MIIRYSNKFIATKKVWKGQRFHLRLQAKKYGEGDSKVDQDNRGD